MTEDAPPYDADNLTRFVRAQLDRRVTEKQWTALVLDAARVLGWSCYHTYDSRRSAPGFPDIVAVRGPVALALELKTETGRPTPAQERWLTMLAAVPGVTARLARPSQWDEIVHLLQGES